MRFLAVLFVALLATSVFAAPMLPPENALEKGLMEAEQEVSKLPQAPPRPMVGNRPPPLITSEPNQGLQPHVAPTWEGWAQVPDAPRGNAPSMRDRLRGDASHPSSWTSVVTKVQKSIKKKTNWKNTIERALEQNRQEKAAAGSVDENMMDIDPGQGSGHGWPYHPGSHP